MTKVCRPLFKPFYFAFVLFDTIENAKKAIEVYRYPIFKEGMMSRAGPFSQHVRRDNSNNTDFQSCSVYVKGFEKLGWNHEDLYAKFCTYGRIISCKVSISPEHKFNGYGYIQYSKLEEAQYAINEVSSYLRFLTMAVDGQLRPRKRRCEGSWQTLRP